MGAEREAATMGLSWAQKEEKKGQRLWEGQNGQLMLHIEVENEKCIAKE